MNDVVEVVAILALVALVGFLITRIPDTRKAFGDDLDDALYKGGVRALWLLIALAAIALLALSLRSRRARSG